MIIFDSSSMVGPHKLAPIPRRKHLRLLKEKQNNWVLDCVNENKSKLKPYSSLRDKYLKYFVIGVPKKKHSNCKYTSHEQPKTIQSSQFKSFLHHQRAKVLQGRQNESDMQYTPNQSQNKTQEIEERHPLSEQSNNCADSARNDEQAHDSQRQKTIEAKEQCQNYQQREQSPGPSSLGSSRKKGKKMRPSKDNKVSTPSKQAKVSTPAKEPKISAASQEAEASSPSKQNQTDRHVNKLTDKPADKSADKKAEKQTDRPTDRPTEKPTCQQGHEMQELGAADNDEMPDNSNLEASFYEEQDGVLRVNVIRVPSEDEIVEENI